MLNLTGALDTGKRETGRLRLPPRACAIPKLSRETLSGVRLSAEMDGEDASSAMPSHHAFALGGDLVGETHRQYSVANVKRDRSLRIPWGRNGWGAAIGRLFR
jgi:hypothetical protein